MFQHYLPKLCQHILCKGNHIWLCVVMSQNHSRGWTPGSLALITAHKWCRIFQYWAALIVWPQSRITRSVLPDLKNMSAWLCDHSAPSWIFWTVGSSDVSIVGFVVCFLVGSDDTKIHHQPPLSKKLSSAQDLSRCCKDNPMQRQFWSSVRLCGTHWGGACGGVLCNDGKNETKTHAHLLSDDPCSASSVWSD